MNRGMDRGICGFNALQWEAAGSVVFPSWSKGDATHTLSKGCRTPRHQSRGPTNFTCCRSNSYAVLYELLVAAVTKGCELGGRKQNFILCCSGYGEPDVIFTDMSQAVSSMATLLRTLGKTATGVSQFLMALLPLASVICCP